MRRHLAWLALPALALACILNSPTPSYAQRGHHGGGHYGGYHGGGFGRGYGGGFGRGYGGYGRGFGYGGIGLFGGGLGYGGWGYPGYGYGGWGRGYGGYGGYGSYGGYYSPYYYSTPIYSNAYMAAPVIATNSFYPSSVVGQPAVDGSRAYIHVHVPGSAQVTFNDTPTQQTGADRTFVSPQLDPNQRYSYEVTAQWTQNGQPHRESRTVRVTPGQTADVNFVTPTNNDATRVR